MKMLRRSRESVVALATLVFLVGCSGRIAAPGTGDAPSSGSGPARGSGGSRGTGGPGSPNAGGGPTGAGVDPRPLRRLTPLEYVNTVRDLLGLDASAEAAQLPIVEPDESGFATPGALGAVEVDRLRGAAESLAARAAADPTKLAPCTGTDQRACASAFLGRFLPRAFRRAVSAGETGDLMKLYDQVRAAPLSSDHSAALRLLLTAVLQSPDFLYHWERADALSAGMGGFARLSPYELASRLSYALWATMPDDALFADASSGKLTEPATLEGQARRLLADARAQAMVDDFHEQWLNLYKLAVLDKDTTVYPAFDASLAASMRSTAKAFARFAVLEDGHLDALLTSTTAFVDDRLASLYKLPAGSGGALRRVTLSADQRAGLLTQPGFLTIAARTDGSSPVRRGKFVRSRLLCSPPPPPPPNVNTNLPTVGANVQTRELYQQHSSDPACAGCHRSMDGIGFALEHYDGIGVWRADEAGRRIDATGETTLGDERVTFDGAIALSRTLAARSEVHECVTRQWLAYLTATSVDDRNTEVLTDVLARFGDQRDLRELIVGVVTSRAFTLRQPTDGEVLR